MSRTEVSTLAARQAFWRVLTMGDSDAARRLTREQLDGGLSGRDLIGELIVPAQRHIGNQWQQGQWSVAEGHAATEVVSAAVSVLEQRSADSRSEGPVLLLTCAEAESHTMPARLAAQLAREAGADVRLLGSSLPAEDLQSYFSKVEPYAVLVSATMPTSLPGAARTIAAAREVGVPSIVGGSAFGTNENRAMLLQADAWLADPSAILSTADRLRGPSPAREPAAGLDTYYAPPIGSQTRGGSLRGGGASLQWGQYYEARAQAAPVVLAAHDRLHAGFADLKYMSDDYHARVFDHLRQIVDFAATALLLDEPQIMTDYARWWGGIVVARGIPSRAIDALVGSLLSESSGPLHQQLAAMRISLGRSG